MLGSYKNEDGSQLYQVLGFRRSSFLCVFYVVFYISYLVTGGFMFTALEEPTERRIRAKVEERRNAFLAKHPCVTDDELEQLIEEISLANSHGISALKNASGDPNWSFGQALFFSGTVVTTIGYGHVTPLTKAGKLFTIMYAMLGIPLTLILVTAVVERLMIVTSTFLKFLNTHLNRFYQPLNIRLIHLSIILIILVTLFILIPATIFARIEPNWDYLDSLYYCFITVTTIGLGDYIPGDSQDQEYRALYKVFTTCYLIIGLISMILALTIFYDIPQLNVGTFILLRADERHDSEKTGLINSKSTPHIRNYTNEQDNNNIKKSYTFIQTERPKFFLNDDV